jgi:hypothetical protein
MYFIVNINFYSFWLSNIKNKVLLYFFYLTLFLLLILYKVLCYEMNIFGRSNQYFLYEGDGLKIFEKPCCAKN